MITDPEEIRSNDKFNTRGASHYLDIFMMDVYARIFDYFDSDSFANGIRIVMNITDMKKLMEINHDH